MGRLREWRLHAARISSVSASALVPDATASTSSQDSARRRPQVRRPAVRWLSRLGDAAAARSAARPSPSRALTNTRGTRTPPSQLERSRAAARGRCARLEPVELVEDQHLRHVGRRRSRAARAGPRRSARRSCGLAASTTCSSRSASAASCSVASKASTSLCGRSRMKPTVSDSDTERAGVLEVSWRVVVSSVANSWSAA